MDGQSEIDEAVPGQGELRAHSLHVAEVSAVDKVAASPVQRNVKSVDSARDQNIERRAFQ